MKIIENKQSKKEIDIKQSFKKIIKITTKFKAEISFQLSQ